MQLNFFGVLNTTNPAALCLFRTRSEDKILEKQTVQKLFVYILFGDIVRNAYLCKQIKTKTI